MFRRTGIPARAEGSRLSAGIDTRILPKVPPATPYAPIRWTAKKDLVQKAIQMTPGRFPQASSNGGKVAMALNQSSERIRRRAKRCGYRVIKSRERAFVPHSGNFGKYMVVNDRNEVVLGSSYDADLDEINEFLNAEQAALVSA
jgi:hypothetical protein